MIGTLRLLILALALFPALAKADCGSLIPLHDDDQPVELGVENHVPGVDHQSHHAMALDMSEQASLHDGHDSMNHSDCDSQCSLCASCSPAVHTLFPTIAVLPPPPAEPPGSHINPLHNSSPPFRPPILS